MSCARLPLRRFDVGFHMHRYGPDSRNRENQGDDPNWDQGWWNKLKPTNSATLHNEQESLKRQSHWATTRDRKDLQLVKRSIQSLENRLIYNFRLQPLPRDHGVIAGS